MTWCTACHAYIDLYIDIGKPYLCSCEGNEAAHQKMRRFFRDMCSKSSKKFCAALQFTNQHAARRLLVHRTIGRCAAS